MYESNCKPNQIPDWKFDIGKPLVEKTIQNLKTSLEVKDEVFVTYQSVHWIQGNRKISLNNIKGICTKITGSLIRIKSTSDNISMELSLPLVPSVIKSIKKI